MKQKLILVLIFISSIAFGQDYRTIVAAADAHYDKKEYAQSVQRYKEAFKVEQKNRNDLYNAACSAALAGDKKSAFKWLKLSLKNGWTSYSHLKKDEDLQSLHDTKKWNKLLAKIQKKVDKTEANYDKPLQQELLAINEEDQKYRQQVNGVEKKYGRNSMEYRALWNTINLKDSINLIKVKAILAKYGWVGADKIGTEANQTIFLVIQHADLATQQQYLPMMRQAVKDKKAKGSALALLEDRIALREGRRQVYGSQIGSDNDTGKYFVSPLEDPDNVDKRRAEVGLGLLADYVKNWQIEWNPEEYKKQLPDIEAKYNKK